MLQTIPPALIICGLPFKDTLPTISHALFVRNKKNSHLHSDSPLSIKDGLPPVFGNIFFQKFCKKIRLIFKGTLPTISGALFKQSRKI